LRIADLLGDWGIGARFADWTPATAALNVNAATKTHTFMKQIMQRLSEKSEQKLQHAGHSGRGNTNNFSFQEAG